MSQGANTVADQQELLEEVEEYLEEHYLAKPSRAFIPDMEIYDHKLRGKLLDVTFPPKERPKDISHALEAVVRRFPVEITVDNTQKDTVIIMCA